VSLSRTLWLGYLALLSLGHVSAEVRCAGIFGDGMVLQQGLPVPVWGRATPGEAVVVQFQGQVESAVATDGQWLVVLDPLRPGGPDNLVVSGQQNTVVFRDVLVGEVWLCSGQSNMAYRVELTRNATEAIAGVGRYPIRLLSVPKEHSQLPRADLNMSWQPATAESVANFSAVGYYFGAALAAARNVPIGLIDASVGGTPIECWMSRASIEQSGDDQALLTYQRAMSSWDQAVRRTRSAEVAWQQAKAAAIAAGQPVPAPPFDETRRMPTVMYNGLIAPWQPFALRGVVWYQGESNVERSKAYRNLLTHLIDDWRSGFGQPDLPFLLIQLPGYQAPGAAVASWAEVREAQLLTSLFVPRTGLVVTYDLGESDNLHPRYKKPIGERAANLARNLVYGERVPAGGPVFETMTVEAGRVRLSFGQVNGGLRSSNGPLEGFAVAGAGGYFYPAQAVIQGGDVLVYSPEVDRPVAVRYGWGNVPRGNLTDAYGNPASPFRTDGDSAPRVATGG